MSSSKPNLVHASEILSRYIFAKDHYSVLNQRIKYNAFMPPSSDLHISVFRTSHLSESDIWSIGEDISLKSDRILHGRGEVVAAEVRRLRLDIDPDNKPIHHANIVGWPEDKPQRQLIAQQLASVATLKLKPPQPNKG